jgi:hypothetical protein
VAEKARIQAQVDALKKETREHELRMRAKAAGVGNIVGKDVPVSMSEVRAACAQAGTVVEGARGRMIMRR